MQHRILGPIGAIALVAAMVGLYAESGATPSGAHPLAGEGAPPTALLGGESDGMQVGSRARYDADELVALVGELEPEVERHVRDRLEELNRGQAQLLALEAELVNAHVAAAIRAGAYRPHPQEGLPGSPGALYSTLALVGGRRVALEIFAGDSVAIDEVRLELDLYARYADSVVDALLLEVR